MFCPRLSRTNEDWARWDWGGLNYNIVLEASNGGGFGFRGGIARDYAKAVK
jgi:hypothetical protein